jgi:hypothetical protein
VPRYLIQFRAGLGDLVRAGLSRELDSLRVEYADDSAILVHTDAPEKKLRSLTYVRNCFLVLDEVRRGELSGALGELANRVRRSKVLPSSARGEPFRLMFSVDGQLIGAQPAARSRLSAAIERQTGGRQHARGGRGVEFWVIGRRDYGRFLFGLRLQRPPATATAAGALAPDLATLLVLAGEPQRDDVFLDPFAGSGAVVTARAAWPYRELICADIVRPGVPRVPRLRVLAEDARTLQSIADHSVNMIVTDPPWYEFERGVDDFDEFMRATLATLVRVLVPSGSRLVMLMSRQRAPSVAALWKDGGLVLRGEIPILVNGHPASVLIGGIG